MKYTIQKGLVRETVCGKELLIATLEARRSCPYLTVLNSASAYIWDLLEAGYDTEDMVRNVVTKYQISENDARSVLDRFIDELIGKSFITEITDEMR